MGLVDQVDHVGRQLQAQRVDLDLLGQLLGVVGRGQLRDLVGGLDGRGLLAAGAG